MAIIINKVCIIGRLTKDPELKFIPNNGMAVCKFTLAINRVVKKDAPKVADFINCVAWGKTAETISTHVRKGHNFGVDGRLQTRNYEDKDGRRIYTTDVIVDSFTFLEKRGDSTTPIPDGNGMTFVDDDVPF